MRWLKVNVPGGDQKGRREPDGCRDRRYENLYLPDALSYREEFVETSNFKLLSDSAGIVEVGLFEHATEPEVFDCPALQPQNRYCVERTDANDVETHEEGDIVVDSTPDDEQIVEEVAVKSQIVEDGPVVQGLVHHEWQSVPSVFVVLQEVMLRELTSLDELATLGLP